MGVYMSQSAVLTENRSTAFRQRTFQEAVEFEHKRQSLREERRRLEEEKIKFESEKKEFSIKKQIEDRRMEQEKQLFEMKWKILESELKKLAAEKEEIEKQRKSYRRAGEQANRVEKKPSMVVRGELFFCGVTNKTALKKRYKDLIKIYHPDNASGDKSTLQEINNEYEKLKVLYG